METLLVLVLNPGILDTSECEAGKYPHLTQSADSVTLKVEGVEVASVDCRYPQWQEEALLAWGCAFYIFNLKNGKKGSNMNWFLREKVLHLQQEGSVSARVLQNVEELEAVLEADIEVV